MRKAQLLWKFMVLKGLQINDYIFSCIRLFGYYVIPGIYLSYPLSPKTKFLSPPINKLVLRVCVCVFSLPSWKINVKVSGKSFFFFSGWLGRWKRMKMLHTHHSHVFFLFENFYRIFIHIDITLWVIKLKYRFPRVFEASF